MLLWITLSMCMFCMFLMLISCCSCLAIIWASSLCWAARASALAWLAALTAARSKPGTPAESGTVEAGLEPGGGLTRGGGGLSWGGGTPPGWRECPLHMPPLEASLLDPADLLEAGPGGTNPAPLGPCPGPCPGCRGGPR